MRKYDVEKVAELVMSKLTSEGIWSTQKRYSLKSIGLRPLLKHFENVGSYSVDNDMVKSYLEEQYDIYKGDRKQAWRWKLMRRGSELIMYFAATGKTAKSILISCGARLAPFDIKELRELMRYDELELDELGDRKTALFVIISDTDDTFNFVVAMMYTQLFNLLCDKAVRP